MMSLRGGRRPTKQSLSECFLGLLRFARNNRQGERFLEGAAVLSVATFFSYFTGLMRDRIFAQTFGASRELDIYNASFIIPDLLLNILVLSGLSAAFIPIFTELITKEKRDHANNLANTVLHGAVSIILIAGLFAAIFMPSLAHFVAPGFSQEELATLVRMARFMLLSPLILSISSTFGALLVSFKSFLAYGLSPVFYNIGIIAGTLTAPWFGIYGVLIGTLCGVALHLFPRAISILHSPFQYQFLFSWRDIHFKRVIRLMIPKMIGHPVEPLMFMMFTRIATLLAAGSVTAVSFARNFQSVPVALFGIAFSVAIFPTLSELAAKSDRENFMRNFWKVFRDILIFTVPSALALYFLSDIPIRIFLGGGRFSDENILRTSGVLSIFAFSIPTESLIHLLARSFYALKNTIIPVATSLLRFALAVSFAYEKYDTLGILAIPWGFFLGSASEVAVLSLLLKRKLRVIAQRS